MKNNLLNYCRWNDAREILKILEEESNIDLTYDNGIYFKLAVKFNNVEILESLLQYYTKTRLQGDRGNIDYKLAQYKLYRILQDVDIWFDISKEMQLVLNKYLPAKGEDSDQESGDLKGVEPDFFDKTIYASANFSDDDLSDLNKNHDKSSKLIGENNPKIE